MLHPKDLKKECVEEVQCFYDFSSYLFIYFPKKNPFLAQKSKYLYELNPLNISATKKGRILQGLFYFRQFNKFLCELLKPADWRDYDGKLIEFPARGIPICFIVSLTWPDCPWFGEYSRNSDQLGAVKLEGW